MFDLPAGGRSSIPRECANSDLSISPNRNCPAIFPKCARYAGQCQFNNCLHLEEPGCEVKKAVQEGRILHGQIYQLLPYPGQRSETHSIEFQPSGSTIFSGAFVTSAPCSLISCLSGSGCFSSRSSPNSRPQGFSVSIRSKYDLGDGNDRVSPGKCPLFPRHFLADDDTQDGDQRIDPHFRPTITGSSTLESTRWMPRIVPMTSSSLAVPAVANVTSVHSTSALAIPI
jgi:hypothetical protein